MPGCKWRLCGTRSAADFYIMHGGLTALDAEGRAIGYDNAASLLDYCDRYYRGIGMPDNYIDQFVR